VVVVVAAKVTDGDPSKTWLVILLLLAIGVAVGIVNGTVTTRLGVPSFITTLGMLLILEGAVFLWTDGAPTGALPDNFRSIGREGIEGIPLIDELPWSVLLAVAVGAAAVWLMRADFGRRLMAVGGNARAAALSGVNVPRARTIAFVLSGVCAALAGILLGGFGGISAQVGRGLEFEAITAVVLGGAVLGGGRGSVTAAMAGALTLEALFTLLNLQGVSGALEDAVQGVIIIAAVAFASYRLRGT
jgi:ribose transport system permease protein